VRSAHRPVVAVFATVPPLALVVAPVLMLVLVERGDALVVIPLLLREPPRGMLMLPIRPLLRGVIQARRLMAHMNARLMARRAMLLLVPRLVLLLAPLRDARCVRVIARDVVVHRRATGLLTCAPRRLRGKPCVVRIRESWRVMSILYNVAFRV